MRLRKFFVPSGHFYSPCCDPEELRSMEDYIWPTSKIVDSPGIDYNIRTQLELLNEFARFSSQIQFALNEGSSDNVQYFYANDQFPCLDAEALFCFLRFLRPARIIEIGSGYSSLIMAEVNRKFFSETIQISCVEPFPRQFLLDGIPGISELVKEKVQLVPLSFFDRLRRHDILFIDSSHVSKTGSDVNYELFEILPRLAPGVYVHIHDIFLPDDYPKKWAIDDLRNWNEEYLVRAFLQFNSHFEIAWSSYLLSTRYQEETQRVFPRFLSLGAGGSLWIRRTK